MKIIEEEKIIEEKDFSLFRSIVSGRRNAEYRLDEKDQVVLCIYDAFANLIVVEKKRVLFDDTFITVPSIKIEPNENPKDVAIRLLENLNINWKNGVFFNTAIFQNNPELSNSKTFVFLFSLGSNDLVLNQVFDKDLPEEYLTLRSINIDSDEFPATNLNVIIRAHIAAMKNLMKEVELAKKAEELNEVLKKVGDSSKDIWEQAISEKLRNGEEPDILQIGKDIAEKEKENGREQFTGSSDYT